MWMALGLRVASWMASTGLQSVMATTTDLYKAKLQAGDNQDKLAADLAARELQLQAQDAQLQASLAARDGAGPRKLIGYSVGLYLAKLYVWDKVLGLGATDDLSDKLTWVMQTVIIAYFGHSAIVDAVRTFRRK